MLAHSVPPGYRRREPAKRPKLGLFTRIIDRILEDDQTVHRKQHRTAKRIFDRLRDEHGFEGGEPIVRDYIRERRRHFREMFIAGVERKAHFFAMHLPHSDKCFVRAYPAATTEAWLDGLNAALGNFSRTSQMEPTNPNGTN